MKKKYSLKWTIDGEENRLGDRADFKKRGFFETREEAEQEAAWLKAVHPSAQVVIQEFCVEE